MPSGPAPYILSEISDFNLTVRKTYTSAALSSQAQMAMAAIEWHRGSFGISAERQQPRESMRRTKRNPLIQGKLACTSLDFSTAYRIPIRDPLIQAQQEEEVGTTGVIVDGVRIATPRAQGRS